MQKLCTFIIAIIVSANVFGQAPNWAWAKSEESAGYSFGASTATDRHGNIYVTGTYESPSITFGNYALTNADTSGNTRDIYIVKYNTFGNVLWAKRYGGFGDDFVNCITTDNSNVYIAGQYIYPTTSFGTFTLTNVGFEDIFIAKLDSMGNVQMAKSNGGTDNDRAYSINTDAFGNLYVAGIYSGYNITFGNYTLTNADNWTANTQDIFIVKYDSLGNVLWAKGAGGAHIDNVTSISTDASGNSYITGFFSYYPINFGTITLPSTGGCDMFIAKYDDLGNLIWAESAVSPNGADGSGISTDTIGNVYATGNYYSTITFGAITLNSAGGNGIFTVKYDSTGSVIWAKSISSTGQFFIFNSTSDASGNVYATGYYQSPSIIIGLDTLINADSTGNSPDILLIKYDNSGNLLWAKGVGGVGTDMGSSITIDNFGNLFVTGSYTYSSAFGSDTLTSIGGYDMFLAKLDSYIHTNCIADYTLIADSALQSVWYLINQCMGSDSLSADSLTYVWSWGDSLNSTSTGAYPSFTYSSPGNYVICVTITDSITGCISTYCDSSTYINRSSNQMIYVNVIPANSPFLNSLKRSDDFTKPIIIYPNPTKDKLFYKNLPKDATITIYNMMGEVCLIQRTSRPSGEFTGASLSKGIYFVKVTDSNGKTEVSKVVKE